MKKLERIALLIAIIGFALRLLDIPGGGGLIVISLLPLMITYFLLGFAFLSSDQFKNVFSKDKAKKPSTKRIFYGIGMGFMLSAGISGFMYKTMLWSGAEAQMHALIGLIFTSLALVLNLLFYWRKPSPFLKGSLLRSAIVFVLIAVAYLIPMNLLIDIYHAESPKYRDMLKASAADPDNQALKDSLRQMELEQYKQR